MLHGEIVECKQVVSKRTATDFREGHCSYHTRSIYEALPFTKNGNDFDIEGPVNEWDL